MPARRRLVVAASILGFGTGLGLSGQQPAQNPPPSTGTAFIAGQVIEVPSGRPIPGATVSPATFSAGGRGRSATPIATDGQGRFFFANLPAGALSLIASKTGYASLNPVARRIDLIDGVRITDLRLRLVKLVSVSGTVRDDGGDPVVGAEIRLIRRTVASGQTAWLPAGTTRTDDRGEYRIAGLTPGTFVVCACAQDVIPFDRTLLTTLASQPMQLLGIATRAASVGGDAVVLDDRLRTFAPTFYPNSSSVAESTRLTLAPGDDRRDVDITVTAVRALRVSGTISGSVSPLLSRSIRLVPAGETDEAALISGFTPVLVQPDGRFDFAGIPPGQYTLRVQHNISGARGGGSPSGSALMFLGARGSALPQSPPGSPTDPVAWAAEPVTVGQDHVQGLSVTLRQGTAVRGRIVFSGTGAPPPSGRGGAITLARIPLTAALIGPGAIGPITPDGTFAISGVVPGRYLVNPPFLAGWQTVKSIVAGGIDITDTGLEIGGNDVDDLVVTLSDARQASIDGRLADAAAASAEDLTAVVFPADRQLWSRPAAVRGRFRSAPIDRKGTFSIANLPGGAYFIAVLPDDQALEWQDGPPLEALARTAMRIILADGDKQSVQVRR
jgi:carboxypeptidase family protein